MDQAVTAVQALASDAARGRFDAIVVGSGATPGALAGALAAAGQKVAWIEDGESGDFAGRGGTVVRMLLASARVAQTCRRAGAFGIATGPVKADFRAIRERARTALRREREAGIQALAEAGGVRLVGEAAFRSPTTIALRAHGGQCTALRADRFFLYPGRRSTLPEVPGLSAVPYATAETLLAWEDLPAHVVVLGGTAAGVECAQALRRLGSKVTLVENQPQLLPGEDRDVTAALAEALRQDGINLFLEARAAEVALSPGGGVRVGLAVPLGQKALRGSHVLVADGTAPDCDGLDLRSAGIAVDERGHIRVDEHLQTSVPGIYAPGECAEDGLRMVRTAVLGSGVQAVARLPCQVLLTDPEFARVGLTETEARAQHRKVAVAKLPLARFVRARDEEEARGLVKAIVDRDSGRVLGVAVLGAQAIEIAGMIEIAMLGGLDCTVLRDGAFAHAALARSLDTLFSTLDPGADET